jgi:diguanylate cyclase (GGDEF)-like protein
MKAACRARSFFALTSAAVVLACCSFYAAWAAEPQPETLTTLAAVHALSNAEASKKIHVALEATVIYKRQYDRMLFVQDGDSALFVFGAQGGMLVPGDRILIQGITAQSFRPLIVADSVTLLHHGALPRPTRLSFAELMRGQYDCRLVTVRARVRTADLVAGAGAPEQGAVLQMVMDDGPVEAYLDTDDESALKGLLGAEVEITGVMTEKFDDKMEQTGILLYVSSLAHVKILKRAGASPWSLPVTPIDQVLAGYKVHDLTPTVRVHGTITYYQPGAEVVLQNQSRSIVISTRTREPLQIGDDADATGFPEAQDLILTLTDGEIRDNHIPAPITPQPGSWEDLALWNSPNPVGYRNNLVSIEGQVVTEVREAAQDEYVLTSGGLLFEAIYRHSPGVMPHPPAMRRIAVGSRVRVTGICTTAETGTFNPGQHVPFNILLRSNDDIAVIAGPSLLNIRNLLIVVGLLFAVLVALGSISWALERKVRRQTTAMAARREAEAALLRRRSAILEDINGSRPLAEIIERIAELVSFELDGAPCWCQISDGAQLGNCPPEVSSLRIVRAEIPARSGSALGSIFAGFDPRKSPAAGEANVLSVGTWLATLAIETRKLYSDLKHRSEFDLLTEIHNRFSLERYLDAQIEEARERAGIFGLVYVDLDEFKQVNDRYGHLVGDMYLQEVALRMKRQLRPQDMLARLGGDEFAILVPLVHSRAEVKEIAQRLERAFDAPYVVEGYALQGSASVGIALYPEDGATRDGLLSAADAAMYMQKQSKQHEREPTSAQVNQTIAPREGE